MDYVAQIKNLQDEVDNGLDPTQCLEKMNKILESFNLNPLNELPMSWKRRIEQRSP